MKRSAAFTEQPFDIPFAAQPAERRVKINFHPAKYFYFIGDGAQLAQPWSRNAFRCEDDNG